LLTTGPSLPDVLEVAQPVITANPEATITTAATERPHNPRLRTFNQPPQPVGLRPTDKALTFPL
jgi:hypothetical protein